jgi:hypothetical protein
MARMKFNEMFNKKFGRLTVIEFVGSKNKRRMWKCQCECGNTTIVSTSDLATGNTTSCGCKHKELYHKHSVEMKTHGMTNTRLYHCWTDMKQRCTNPKNAHFKYYGGRGIKVCEEWNNSTNFIEWALKNGYRDDLTLDRINVNGNYEPSNCRWATIKEQANNKTNNVFYTHNGETLTLAQWCERLGLNSQCISSKVHKQNIPLGKALGLE